MSGVAFRVARRAWELEQVHRLNRDVFALEVGQHAAPADGDAGLVDRFDAENTYVVAVDGRTVVGMLAVRDRRPFSLDEKLPDLDRHLEGRLPSRGVLCEVRLLAIARDRRQGLLLPGLMSALWRLGRARSYTAAVLSAYPERVALYERLGCEPFGPRVERDGFAFQPMLATAERFVAALARLGRGRARREESDRAAINFLPGPVRIEPAVRRAFAASAISHRSTAFDERLARAKSSLLALTGAGGVEIMPGSGTLANDVVAAQLALRPGRGLVLASGEFGERLAGAARRHRLAHDVLRAPWGEPLPLDAVAQALDRAAYAWLWCTHCETSTGVLHDLPAIVSLAEAQGVAVAADCISTLGLVPVDLARVALATGTSGKGLRSFPGLALVFYREPVHPQPERLPSYLDLGTWIAARGVPFTHSSNLAAALAAALEEVDLPARRAALARTAPWLRSRLAALGFSVLAAPEHASPAVFTLPLPPSLSSRAVGDRLRARSVLVSYESGYLLERNWIQICLMGAARRPELERLLAELATLSAEKSGTG